MALYPNPSSELIREPNLLIPGKKPVGAVKIDWSNALAKDLLSFYLMNDSGLNLKDIANGNDGTLQSTVSRDKPQELLFAGGRVALPSPITFINSDKLTIFSHVKVTTPFSSDRTIVGDWYDFSLLWADVGGPDGYAGLVKDADGINVVAGTDNAALILDTWQWVCMTYDGDEVVIYVDGVSVSSASGGNGLLAHTWVPSIGSYSVGSYNKSFAGSMKDIRLYKRALTPAEMFELYIDPYQFLIPA
jgi:hypothetical protein